MVGNKIMKGTFIQRFEKIFGDIRDPKNKQRFGSAYSKYYDGERFDWHQWDKYQAKLRDMVEFDSMVMDRELSRNIRNHIHQECQGVVAYRKITK